MEISNRIRIKEIRLSQNNLNLYVGTQSKIIHWFTLSNGEVDGALGVTFPDQNVSFLDQPIMVNLLVEERAMLRDHVIQGILSKAPSGVTVDFVNTRYKMED